MELILVVIGFIVFAVFVLGATVLFLQYQQRLAVDKRLEQFTETTMTLEEMELEQPFHERVLVPAWQALLNTLGKLSPQRANEKVRENLAAAGITYLTPGMFSGLRLVLAFVMLLIFGAVTVTSMGFVFNTLLYTTIGVGIGYMAPGIWLDRKIRQRKHNIQRSLPDALDLLTISVEAGLGFDVALQRVSNKWDDELSREFRRALSDMQLGRSRREALRDMAERTGVEDVRTFVSAVIQADQLGVPMSKILRLQSDQMRVRRRQRAEELAQQAPIKMLFPMVFLIFPALFVVILGPAIPRILEAFGD